MCIRDRAVEGITFTGFQNGKAVFELASGSYTFRSSVVNKSDLAKAVNAARDYGSYYYTPESFAALQEALAQAQSCLGTVSYTHLDVYKRQVDGCDTQLSAHSYQLWNLLGYLIVFRRREIPHYELIKMLWPEDDIDNPSNALKNLIYRIRTNLSKNGHPALKGMIAYSCLLYTSRCV